MAELFPEFRNHFHNVIDLWKPFDNQYYCVKEMGRISSSKVVLPSLFPNNLECNYNNLNQVHKRNQASVAYLLLPTLFKEEQESLINNMLIYCGRDIYVTVKLYEKLRDVVR